MPTGHYLRKPWAKTITFRCEICGKVVSMRWCDAKRRTRRFCSHRCAKRKPQNFRKLNCESCSRIVTRHKSHIMRHVYCSNKCAGAARRKGDAKWRDAKQIRAYMEEYARRNKEKLNKKHREWAVRNHEKRLNSQRKWREANKDKIATHAQARRVHLSDGSFTAEEWQEIKARYAYTCLRCGRKEPEITLHIDHVVPLVLGGKHNAANIQPLCGPCNSAKHAKIIDYRPSFVRKRKQIDEDVTGSEFNNAKD